ncbi:phage head closure protein [Clostridium sp.]|uniref:phage head closure protein n=1 Tax=Clostridium sp. TaxID=1506 RepID=UPI002FCC5DEE
MNAGELRQRIEVQHYVDIENELLEEVKDWKVYKNVWASIKCVGHGREQIKNKEQSSLNYEITIRYIPGITTKMRVKHKEKYFNINHVVNYNELNKELHLFCTEVVEGVYNE